MVYHNKNKNELLVFTGAVYSFVAYMTAFTLEVLFIIDLAKRNSNLISSSLNNPAGTTVELSTSQASQEASSLITSNTFDQARLAIESMQSHVTISSLAISVLYFVIFVASLLLIVAIILRSSFFLLIWICTMSTMYLPEFVLIIYVSVYGWGLSSRNGQIELIFYSIRAVLNVIFVFRAYRMYREWREEKNFFRLKSSSLCSSTPHDNSVNRFTAGYDSPYFIGDSLTTTINPVFAATGSTLNLDRYDAIRETLSGGFATRADSFGDRNRRVASMYAEQAKLPSAYLAQESHSRHSAAFADFLQRQQPSKPSAALQNMPAGSRHARHQQQQLQYQLRPSSVLSINSNLDDFTDCEMDLDYRTLTNQRHYRRQEEEERLAAAAAGQARPRNRLECSQARLATPVSYSTQSLDRRHLNDMDFARTEQVLLRPLKHQRFEYLYRPGSNNNLEPSGRQSPNTRPSSQQAQPPWRNSGRHLP